MNNLLVLITGGAVVQQRTVRDFKNFLLTELGLKRFNNLRSYELADFWGKLNNLGYRYRTKECEETKDIDATAFLTDEQWKELELEFATIRSRLTAKNFMFRQF